MIRSRPHRARTKPGRREMHGAHRGGGGGHQRSAVSHSGLTLIELVVVLLILIALAGVIIPNVAGTADDARGRTTEASLRRLQDVIMNRYWPDMNAVMQDDAGNPIGGFPHPSTTEITAGRLQHPQLRYLYFQPADPAADFNPLTRRGWNGPYIRDRGTDYLVIGMFTSAYGETNDPAPVDAWGHAIVIQSPDPDGNGLDADELNHTRLVSAGADGVIDTPANVLIPTLAERRDDFVLFLRVADSGL